MGGEEPTDDDLQAAVSHAQDAIRFVDETEADLSLEASYDEYSVVARLDDSRIVGDIDRLLVTPVAYHIIDSPDAYHIIDYKTNDFSSTTTDTLAGHYRPQMLAYALALFSARSRPAGPCFTLVY
jgi:ATP-dependent helicase/nuclease subunit A